MQEKLTTEDKKERILTPLIMGVIILIGLMLVFRGTFFVQLVWEVVGPPYGSEIIFALLIAFLYVGIKQFRTLNNLRKSGAQLQQNNLLQFGRVLSFLGCFGSIGLARVLGVRYTYDDRSAFIYAAIMALGLLMMYAGSQLQTMAFKPESNNPPQVKQITKSASALWKVFWSDNTD